MKKREQDTTEAERFAPPQSTASGPSRITPLDIQQKEFRYARFGGYKMRDVDEFLDRVTESMTALAAENDRLRSGGLPIARLLGTSDLDDVNRQADEIIQRARDEAARIVADARSRSAGVAAGAMVAGADTAEERAAINAFLAREKEFLQSLAGLVQGHAGSVKEMAREARSKTAPAAAPPAPTPAQAKPAEMKPMEAKAVQPKAAEPKSHPEPDSESAEPKPAVVATSAAAPSPAAKPETTISLPRAEEPVRTEQPATAAVRRDGGDDEGDGGDRSLRDLFWGEE